MSTQTPVAEKISDTKYVEGQLRDVLESMISAKHSSQRHPYGGTTAVERLLDAELLSDKALIFVETETLPVSLRVRVQINLDQFLVDCSRPQVQDSGNCLYKVELVD